MITRVAAVQLPFVWFNTPQEFADHVRGPLELAAQNGAQLILLPHLSCTMLFGMFDFDAHSDDTLSGIAARQNVSTEAWLEERAGYVFEFYLHLFQSLAARVETWLAPGTVLEQENGSLYLTAFLFNPQGEIVGRQRQMHPATSDMNVAPGETLRVFETELGNFGFLIAEDVSYPEIAATLARNGADVLLHPAASTDEAVTSDLKNAVKANRVFAVKAGLLGSNFRGQSAIYAPGDLTNDSQGLLARTETATDGELVLADLDFDTLARLRAADAPV